MKPNIYSLPVYICYKMDFTFKFLFRNVLYAHTTGHVKSHILWALLGIFFFFYLYCISSIPNKLIN